MAKKGVPFLTGQQLQIEVRGTKFTSELIGYEESKYLILKMPGMQLSEIKSAFAPGKPLIVRYLTQGVVMGFKSAVYGVVLNPVRLLIVQYPTEIADHNLRQHPRVKCYFPSHISTPSGDVEGFIVDLSQNGCRFSYLASKQFELEPEHLNEEINIQFSLPGIPEKLVTAGQIKHFKRGDETWSFGIMFTNMGDDVSQKLATYLEEAIFFDK